MFVFVAKGVEARNLVHLRHEAHWRLRPLQGFYVPVCRGIVGLRVPNLYDNAELTQLLLMSWAGRPVLTMQKVDAIPDSIWNTDRTARLMLIDFDRSSVVARKVLSAFLSALSPDKRKADFSLQSLRSGYSVVNAIRIRSYYVNHVL